MNLVLLHYAAHPIVGGVENVMREHSRMMAAAGHHVRIVAGRGAQADDDVEFAGVPLVDSQAPEVLVLKRELDVGTVPLGFQPLSVEIEHRLKEQFRGADWIFAHNVCSLNKNLPLTAALRRISEETAAPRLALWHHDLAWTTPRYTRELHPGFPWDLLRTDWPRALQIAVSGQRRRELAGLLGVPEGRIRVIPNGISVRAFLKTGTEAQAIFEEFHLLDAAPLIVLPARITPRKNIELALRILAALRQQHPRARMVVTGPAGPHNAANAAYLESLLELRRELDLDDSAVFLADATGKVVGDETVSDLYRIADGLLLPSTEEGFGIPILEAGLAGIPVFCSDILPLRELGLGDVTYIAPEGDAGRAAEQISTTLNASGSYALRKRVLREHAWARIYSEHLGPLLEGA
jgi:glycosyltransferase involved in cell wall biosynthesis